MQKDTHYHTTPVPKLRETKMKEQMSWFRSQGKNNKNNNYVAA